MADFQAAGHSIAYFIVDATLPPEVLLIILMKILFNWLR
jgi:hypothetical protein